MWPWSVGDRDDLGLGCSIDGHTVQVSRTSGLVFGVGITGTPPRFLRAGEVLETWVEGIGTIRNDVREQQ